MDLKLEAMSYQNNGDTIRYVIGSDGVTNITDAPDTITITKDTQDIELQKTNLGNWTFHMFANVAPE